MKKVCCLVMMLTVLGCNDSGASTDGKGDAERNGSTGGNGSSTGGNGTATTGGNGTATTGGNGMQDADDAKLEADALAKLKKCQLDDGSDEGIEDDTDRCLLKCLVAADCADFKELLCVENASNPAVSCWEACPGEPADGFPCKDGTKIPHLSLCDGEDDCGDGSDEVGCGTFKCQNGAVLMREDASCDGVDDCADGSDEKNCGPDICG